LLKESAPVTENVKSATISKDAPIASAVKVTQNEPQKPIADALAAWSAAWSSHDLSTYLNSYSTTFQPSVGVSHADWAAKRRARISGVQQISVGITNVIFTIKDASHATTTFHQSYRGDAYHDDIEKTLEWENIGGRWVIVAESNSPR